MRKRFIKIHASDSSALLLGPRSTLQSSSFLPSVSHAGESFTYQGLRIWFYGYVTWTLDYSADLILLAFSISCGGEFHLSRFTHLILRLCYLDLGLLCRHHPSCLQYLMQGRVPSIKVYASNSSAMLLGPWSILQTSSFLPSISHAGEILPIKVYPSDFSAMLLGPWSTLQISSFLPSVSHAGESFTYQGLRICFFGYINWTLEYSANLIFFCLSISRGEHI